MNKKAEADYNYWQNQFDGHKRYMISGNGNEYYKIRRRILLYINDNSSLLDVGCASAGTLHHIKNFSKKNIAYKGVDYASNFIKANKKRFPKEKFEVQDARDLKEKDESYDVVLLYDVLDGLEGWELAIEEAIRVAKDKIIITMWKDNHMDEKLDYMKKRMKVKHFDFHPKETNYHYFIIGYKS
jgi:ubiquinone/menaquinone biosynthesis C-methylase UbiE